MKVRDFMTRDLTSVTPETSLKKAVSLLSKANLTGIAVVNAEQKVIGFLSEKDIMEIIFPSTGGIIHDSIFVHDFSRILNQLTEVGERKVEDAMNADPFVVEEEQTTEEVAEMMLAEGLKIIPVVRPKTQILIGFVSRADLLKALFEEEKDE